MRRVARYADAHVVLSRYLHPEQFRADGIGERWGERIGGWRGRFADLLRRLEAAGCETYVAEWSHRCEADGCLTITPHVTCGCHERTGSHVETEA